ncbi:MAG: amidohydrolase family protein [Gemmobacter sp.]|nr:amidohydrolase family protein [Gemmobacter sp.]
MNPDLTAVNLNGGTVALTLASGRIASVSPVAGPARAVILPLPIDAHVHLDKTHTIGRCSISKPGLFGAIEAMAADKVNWTASDLHIRAERGLAEAYANGTLAIRTHIDWNEASPPLAWSVIGELAQDWRGRMTVQRAALAPLDVLGDTDTGPKIAAQVARDGGVLGCFVYRNSDLVAKLDRVFALAARHDLDLDFHVDEGLDPLANGFDTIVALTARYRMAGRVLCGHACSLSVRPAPEVARVLDAAARAGVALTVLPTTNSHLQDMTPGRTPRLRGLAPMHELRAAGVPVLLAADNVRDPFYPYGSYDLLDVLRQATFAAHLSPGQWLETVTTAPATALGLPVACIAPGEPADFLLIEGADWSEVISSPRAKRHVVRAGQVSQP